MKAVAGDLPSGPGWSYEVKWDGMRVVLEVAAGEVTARSARGSDVTATFPELEGAGAAVAGHDVVLDGEVVVFDDAGVPSFALLQQRMHVTNRREAHRRALEVPVVFVAFDLLWIDGQELWRLPYLERRARLEEVVQPTGPVQVPGAFQDGPALLEAARRRGLEGVVAKRWDALYEPGRRSARWRKVKVRPEQEFVVGGWLGGTGARSGRIGSLVLGCHQDGRLRWVGNVGTGFTDVELRRLADRLTPLEQRECPFEPVPPSPTGSRAVWARPELVVEVAFGEWTSEGRLRHPAYLGERTDKPAAQVTCDP